VVYGPYTVLMMMLLSGWMVAAYAKKKKSVNINYQLASAKTTAMH